MSTTDWFATRELQPGPFLVTEPGHVNEFLIPGDGRAILFDSGLGIGDVRRVVESLTDRDVLVVNSHYHFDHIGGNHLFSEIAIHEAGVEPLGQPVPAEWLTAYTEYAQGMLERFKVFRDVDERYFRVLAPEITLRPLPDDFDPKAWTIVPTVPTRTLGDGDRLDLGGRVLRVIHTPGHTPDCICLLDERSGELFAGDTLCTGPLYLHLPDSSVLDAAASTTRLAKEFLPEVTVVYVAHMLRYATDPHLIVETADALQAIVDGAASARQGIDIFSATVTEFWFERLSVVTPPEWANRG